MTEDQQLRRRAQGSRSMTPVSHLTRDGIEHGLVIGAGTDFLALVSIPAGASEPKRRAPTSSRPRSGGHRWPGQRTLRMPW